MRNFSSKSGFGLVLTGDSPVVVSDIDEGSPASQSDLRVGDIILEVDGHSCVMATHDQVVELISAGESMLAHQHPLSICSSTVAIPQDAEEVVFGHACQRPASRDVDTEYTPGEVTCSQPRGVAPEADTDRNARPELRSSR